MVRAANMSPVPEKKRGSSGVSMRKRRGLKSEVAVEPMMVMFLISSSSCSGAAGGWSEVVASVVSGVDVEGCSEEPSCVGCEAGCVRAGSRCGDSTGVCRPEGVADAGFDPAREGTRDDTVRLSRVNRRDVIITCGTWYFLCST